MYMGSNKSDFAAKLLGYLQEADYRVAHGRHDRAEIFRLRYEAYLKEGVIDENHTRMFHDPYDNMENCWIFGVHLDNRLASSIRFHVISPDCRMGPAYDVFPDIVGPMIDEGLTLIDPTRFVNDPALGRKYPELPYMTLRVACMGSMFFEADYCLATVRREHAAFYRRVFNAEMVCEPRPYPTLKSPICLMKADVRGVQEKLFQRYPIFNSSFTERRMIFGGSRHQEVHPKPQLYRDLAASA